MISNYYINGRKLEDLDEDRDQDKLEQQRYIEQLPKKFLYISEGLYFIDFLSVVLFYGFNYFYFLI